VNYRMNTDFCDKKWTSRDVISSVAFKAPTRKNQLAVMQYLTAIQNPDVTHFPIEAAIDLELGLDWLQITEYYCIPKRD
ncbi:MAG: hypothetical protein GX025_10560, partial [Clostridiales bacterium]|nr:hypothetical protein [Clostridiales bacterium]